jgi:CHAT domain-containing protein
VDNEDPMFSKLAFQQMVDEKDDGFLNTYEIYNMRYNARMAVLSSCNTGYGKLMKGEGVMSLARGFMYAGCPSIVMTLWEVSDVSGADLMQDFYKHLKKGKSKAEALQQAKLDFLKNSNNLRANPYFWSTYVIIGDASPLYSRDINWTFWIAGMMLLSGILLVVLIRIRKRSSKKENYDPSSIYT